MATTKPHLATPSFSVVSCILSIFQLDIVFVQHASFNFESCLIFTVGTCLML